MNARAVSFRLPSIVAVLAGLVIAGLALFSAMALVVVSVLASLAAIVFGRLRGAWAGPGTAHPTEITAEYEVVREQHEPEPLPRSDDA